MDGKRLVFENYPVELLPEGIREEFDATDEIVLTVEARTVQRVPRTISEILDSTQHSRTLTDDPVARIRALRDSGRRDELHARIRRGE